MGSVPQIENGSLSVKDGQLSKLRPLVLQPVISSIDEYNLGLVNKLAILRSKIYDLRVTVGDPARALSYVEMVQRVNIPIGETDQSQLKEIVEIGKSGPVDVEQDIYTFGEAEPSSIELYKPDIWDYRRRLNLYNKIISVSAIFVSGIVGYIIPIIITQRDMLK